MGHLAAVAVMATVALLTCAVGELIKVGGKAGWRENANYTEWAAHRHFYVGDWLYFVFDKHYYSVLQVNRTNYEQCNEIGFVKNITNGGRDVFNLTEAKSYYFLSSGGYCFHGMKLFVPVQEHVLPSPSPPLSSAKNRACPKAKGNVQIMISSFFLFVIAIWEKLNLMI